MFGKKFLGILIIILFLSVGAVTASGNTTTDRLTDGDWNFQKIINDASENDVVEIDHEIEPYTSISIGKNITLQGTGSDAKINYVNLNINRGDVTIKDLALKRAVDYTLIVAKNEKLNLINCTLQYDTAIKFSGKTLTITDCTFKDLHDAITLTDAEAAINNCLFENIKITSIESYNSKLTIQNTTFTNCSFGINAENGEAIIRNNKFINDRAFSLTNTNSIVEQNIFNSSYPSITNPSRCSFKNNKLIKTVIGGKNLKEISDCEFISSRISCEYCSLIKNCTFSNINTEFSLLYNCPNIVISNCSFKDNTFQENMFEIGSNFNFNIENCLFENNNAQNLILGQYFKSIKMDSSKFFKNTFKKSLIQGYESKTISIADSEFKNNFANNALIRLNEIESVKVNSNVISNNTCPNTIHIDYLNYHIDYTDKITTSIDITNNIFSGNHNQKNSASKVFLSPKIASNAIKMKWGTKLNLKNNFYGYNILNTEELSVVNPIKFDFAVQGWQNLMSPTNVEINGNTVKFVDLNGNAVKMPQYTFSIKNKTSNAIIVSDILTKNGKGSFKTSTDVADSYILNEVGSIVNRPKVSISFTKKGNRYDDFELETYLKQGKTPIANNNLKYTIFIYEKSGKLIEKFDESGKTNNAGKFTIKIAPPNYEKTIGYFNVKVTFASEKYAFSQKTIKNIKINKIKTTVKALKVTNKYKKSKYFQATVKNQKTGKIVKNINIKLKIGKKTYNVKTNYQGIAKFNTKSLNIGKYNVAISSGDQRYSISAKSTIVIKK